MDVVDQSKKERLRRLSELNMRSLGVTSFEAPEAGVGVSVTRELVLAIREQKSFGAYFEGCLHWDAVECGFCKIN